MHSSLTTVLAALAALLTHLAAPSAFAVTYYWDTDGATAGFGDTAGTWSTDAFWSTNSTGGASTVFATSTTTNDLLNFAGTGTLALGSTAASVSVNGTVEAGRISFGVAQPAGVPVVLTGGTLKLGGTNAAPHIAPNSTNATINSAIALNSNVEIRGPNGGTGGTIMTLNLNGAIAGGFNVTFNGPSGNNNYSTVVLGAQNTYTGSTLLQCVGTGANLGVKLGIDDALPTTTVLTLDGGNGSGSGRYVRFDLNGYNQTLAGLTTVVRGARRDQCIVNSSATPATLTVNNAADYTFTGQLGSGGGGVGSAPNFGLTKAGVGKLTLSPANTNGSGTIINLQYTGPTTNNNGILAIAGAGRLGNGNYAANIVIASGASLVFTGTNANNLSGTLSGAGTLTNSGTGALTISGTSTLANTVVASGGTIAVNGGFVSRLSADVGGKVSLPGPSAGTVTNLIFAGTGSMSFDVASGGTLTSAVANGITNNGGPGSITIDIVGSVPTFGTYTLISYSGSLQGSGFSAYQLGVTPSGASYTLNDTGSAVQLVVSPALIWTGVQSGEWSTNAITPLQNWNFIGNPANYTNGVAVIFDDTVGGGNTTVDVSVANVTPASVSFEHSSVNYTLQGSKAIAGTSALTKIGSGTLTVLNDNTYTGPTRIVAGTVQVGNGGTNGALGSGVITDNGLLQFNRSNNLSVASAISGTGAVEQNGSGVLVLSGTNTYGGATTINAGTLRLGGSNVLPDGSSATVNGLLDLNTFSDAINGFSGSGTVDTVAGGTSTLTVGANNAGGTFSGTIQNTAGTLSLIKAGNGTLTLSGSNSYSGGTYFTNSGVLALANSSAAGSGSINFASTRLSTDTAATFTLSGGIDVTNALQFDAATGRNTINSLGTTNNALSGNIIITNNAPNIIAFNNNAAASSGTTFTVGGATPNSTTMIAPTFANAISFRASSAGNFGVLNCQINAPSANFNANNNGLWTVNSTGNTWLVTSFSNAGSFILGAHNALATGAPLSFASSATGSLDLNGFNQVVAGFDIGNSGAINIKNTGTNDSTLTLSGLTTNRSFSGIITDGGAGKRISLVMNSSGFTQTLSGTNTYTGTTTISAGTLKLANDSTINLTSGLSIAAGGSLDTVALTVPPPSSIPLTASGTGTTVGTTAAAIIGIPGTTNDLGTRSITLNYNGSNPALYLSGGTLQLNDNPFTINGSVLANGVYTIIAQLDAAPVVGSVASSTANGTALTGKTGTVSLSGNTVILTVTSAGPGGPTLLTNSVSGSTLTLSWPAGQGWRLLQQTNALSVGLRTNWVDVTPGSASSTNITVDKTVPTTFYRLVYP